MRVYATKCDQCGRETSEAKTYLHLAAKCAGTHHRPDFSGGLGAVHATVNLSGFREAQFTEADFCSSTCAGEWLFGLPRARAK